MNNNYYPAFKYVDVGCPGQGKWKRVLAEEIEKYRNEYGNIDFCCSPARYPDPDPSHEQPMLMGIIIDFDSEDDLSIALKDAGSFLDYFYTFWGLKKEEAHLYVSGNRSAHIEIQAETLGIKPHENLHLYIRDIVREISDAVRARTVDFKIYSRRRIFRCVGTQHSKTNRFKIELNPSELNLSPDEIRKLSETNRGPLYCDEDLNLSLNEDASREFYKLFSKVRNYVDEYSYRASSVENLSKLKGISKYPICINDLLENNIRVKDTRNKATLALVSFLKDVGKNKDEIIQILTPWASSMPQSLTDLTEKERIKHVVDMADYIFSESASDYHFACPFILSLGDKAHPISCKPRCQLKLTKNEQDEVGSIFPVIKTKIAYMPEIDGRLVELVYDPTTEQAAFAVYDPKTGEVIYLDEITNDYPTVYIPYIDENVAKNSILLPSHAEEYGSDEQLYNEVNKFIARYYNEPKKSHRILNTLYIFFTWVYDRFTSCCYLQFLGRAGGGKSRALEVTGQICYRPTIIAGADSSASMFRMLDRYRGTALIDEATFTDRSEAHSAIVQVLNVGYKLVPGSVGRCEGDDNRQVRYMVWGPKMLATREDFKDDGLRSRCFVRRMAKDNRIKEGENKQPFILLESFRKEALELRNKLLLWRFRHWNSAKVNLDLEIKSVASRINEIIVPILSVMNSDSIRQDIESLAKEQEEDIKQKLQYSIEGEVLKIIQELNLSRGDIDPATIKEKIDANRPKDKPISTNFITRTLKKLELKLHKYANKWWLTSSAENEELLNVLLKDYGLTETTIKEDTAINDIAETVIDSDNPRVITFGRKE